MNQQQATSLVMYLNRAGLLNAMEGQGAVWADALSDVSYVTAQEVVRGMAATRTTDQRWVTPGDVRAEVARIRKARTSALGEVNPPAELDESPRRSITWLRAYVEAIGDGESPDAATKRACDALGIEVPPQLDPMPRPEAVKRLMAAHGPQCACGCLTKPVRAEEGKP